MIRLPGDSRWNACSARGHRRHTRCAALRLLHLSLTLPWQWRSPRMSDRVLHLRRPIVRLRDERAAPPSCRDFGVRRPEGVRPGMRARNARRSSANSPAAEHAEWLGLIEVPGPFLSLKVLLEAFPQGLDADSPALAAELRRRLGEWQDNNESRRPDPGVGMGPTRRK